MYFCIFYPAFLFIPNSFKPLQNSDPIHYFNTAIGKGTVYPGGDFLDLPRDGSDKLVISLVVVRATRNVDVQLTHTHTHPSSFATTTSLSSIASWRRHHQQEDEEEEEEEEVEQQPGFSCLVPPTPTVPSFFSPTWIEMRGKVRSRVE